MEYAKQLKTTSSQVIELSEGENDDDEMFWMILGDDEFAKADYWKWKRTAVAIDPFVWRVDTTRINDPVRSAITSS